MEGRINMGKFYLIVVDMQQDFVYGALGSKEAQEIVPAVVEKVKQFDGTVIFTRDTHYENYMDSQEGKFLPVVHCMEGSTGWELIDELKGLCTEKACKIYDKGTFGCIRLAADLMAEQENNPIDFIELIGVCTDICVVSNALLIKAHMPEVPVFVDSVCCAGVTPQKHNAALETMRSCQIQVK